MQRTLHVRKPTPNDVISLSLVKFLCIFLGTKCFYDMWGYCRFSGWLAIYAGVHTCSTKKDHLVSGVLLVIWLWIQILIANGAFSVSNAVTTLQDIQVCQSGFWVKCFIHNNFSFQIKWLNTCQPDLLQPCLFLSTLEVGLHRLRDDINEWLPVKPFIGQRICCHGIPNSIHFAIAHEIEQRFLLDCPLNMGIRQQHTVLFGSDQGSICLLLERNAAQIPLVVLYIHLCLQARMSNESHLAPQPRL